MPNTRRVVILCVDDDEILLTTRSRILSLAGYEVLAASSAADALTVLRDREVDLVITDYFLLDMSGAELIPAIRELNPRLPIILMTGAMEPPPGSEQADLLLTKGMNPAALLEVLAGFVRQRGDSISSSSCEERG